MPEVKEENYHEGWNPCERKPTPDSEYDMEMDGEGTDEMHGNMNLVL